MTTRSLRTPLRFLAAPAALGLVVLTAFAAAPAAGHEGAGSVEVVTAEPVGPLTVRFRVLVLFAADGHPAPQATVTATSEQPGHPPATPVVLNAEGDDGHFAGNVTFTAPGPATVRFTSISPNATITTDETVPDPATTTTTAAVTTTTTAAPTTTTAPPPPNTLTKPRERGVLGRLALPAALAGGGMLVGIALQRAIQARRRR